MTYAPSHRAPSRFRRSPRARGGLGATDVSTPIPAPGQPQPPIWPLRVGDHGAWLETRSSPADGACGVSGYPCKHPGVDVAGAQGTPVVSPEDGLVVAAGDGNSAPYVGYGPWFVIVQGLASGKFHLLGHLDPLNAYSAMPGISVSAGQAIGTTSSANHTHWEVRAKAVPDYASGETNFTNNSDPLAWLSASQGGSMGGLLLLGGAALLLILLWRQ